MYKCVTELAGYNILLLLQPTESSPLPRSSQLLVAMLLRFYAQLSDLEWIGHLKPSLLPLQRYNSW